MTALDYKRLILDKYPDAKAHMNLKKEWFIFSDKKGRALCPRSFNEASAWMKAGRILFNKKFPLYRNSVIYDAFPEDEDYEQKMA